VVASRDIEPRTRELAEMLAAAPRSAVEGTKASLVLAARSLNGADAVEQSGRWRLRAATSPERRSALEAAKKRLGRSI
jgi:enoyl-CoA hydratase/carnithine racemase